MMDRINKRRLPSALARGSILLVLLSVASPSGAESVVEVPVLGAISSNNRGVFEVMLLQWDQKASPDPIQLQWGNTRVQFFGAYLRAMHAAFTYAVDRTPAVRHTGTLTIYGLSYVPTSSDGPSAGAAMAVGFIAVLKGDPIRRGVAVTGTLESDGRIGVVGAIPDKVRAAAREGYRTILIPRGQFYETQWGLSSLALELNVTIREVGTVEEAYEVMTGRRF
jgi:hypothetical protein